MNTNEIYYTPYQLKLPVDIERKIEISDEVFTFSEVFDHIDPRKYLAEKDSKMGRPRYDEVILLKVILFAFMEFGYVSTRAIAKLCKTDIRFMWLLQDNPAPSHMTIDNFMKDCLSNNIEEIFAEITKYIFEKENVDTNHVYVDGTKIRANANPYSWVWKKSCIKNRDKVFNKVTELLLQINQLTQGLGVEFGTRSEYAVEYLEQLLVEYVKLTRILPDRMVRGKGHHKSIEQKYYDKLVEYTERLKRYSEHIKICGEERNSYSKTDEDATFFRMKRDHMKNDQLLPGFNVQFGVCDEYIAVFDIERFASDMDCFQPLMNKFYVIHGYYPEYPIADAGYGSYNNYLYCEEHGMKKYMKFTMYEKETKDASYRDNPYRTINFKIQDGKMICPNGKGFNYLKTSRIKGNDYGRCEEYYQCEDCSNCEHREKCHKSQENRIVRVNEELTVFHHEVLENLNCTHGALLRMNRSIQSEGVFGAIKWNRSYTRARRRGLKGLFLEIGLISIGFNLHKYHLKKQIREIAA